MIVERKIHQHSQSFTTQGGFELLAPQTAYEEYGQAGKPAVLVTHGGFQDAHAAGVYSETDSPGLWDALIGPGKPIDTNRYWVLSANSLGSMFGSTGPLSVNPATGRPYGALFPSITFEDTARFHHAFLQSMGVKQLALVAGPSMGGCQSLQLAALYPNYVQAAIGVAVAGRMPPEGIAFHHWLMNTIKSDPQFNEGAYDQAFALRLMRVIHQAARIYFGHESGLKAFVYKEVEDGPVAQLRRVAKAEQFLSDNLEAYLPGRDPNSYIRILEAINQYDLGSGQVKYETGVLRIQCPVLLVNFTTDSEFPPYWGQEVAQLLNHRTPGQAQHQVLPSIHGHYGCLRETDALIPLFQNFIKQLSYS